MPIGSYCERPARTVGPEETVREAAQRMASEAVGCLVVVENGQPKGVVTDRDLVLEVFCNDLDASAIAVGSLVSGPAITVRDYAPLAEAATLMGRHGLRRLPVVDEKSQLVGVITADDLMRQVVSELSGLAAAIEVQATGPEGGSESC